MGVINYTLIIHLRELCRPLSGRRTMRYSDQGDLVVPFASSAEMQCRSFPVVGQTTWNGLPLNLKHLPNGACSQFHQLLKTPFPLRLGRERPLVLHAILK